jgi:hypothetical protein
VISISVDEGDGERPKVIKWAKEMKSGFITVHDPEAASAKAFQLEEGIPYNVVLDRNGKVVGTNGGEIAALEALANRAVAGGGPVARKRARR